jgi:PST family polysaccharide transporter
MIAGYVIGLPYGPTGVGFAYSTVMMLWVLPVIVWSVHGTVISVKDILTTASRPFTSGVVAGGLAFGVRMMCVQLPPLPRLLLEGAVLFIAYVGILFYVMGQKPFYVGILGKLIGRVPVEEKALASA